MNGVFLLALCLSIFLEAIQRFFEPQEIRDPWLVLGVGSAGLASNIVGLFLFHEHGHSHGGHDHGHSHEDIEADAHDHGHSHPVGIHHEDEDEAMRQDRGNIEHILPGSYVKRMAARSASPRPQETSFHRSTSTVNRQQRFASPATDIHVHPALNRQEVLNAAVSEPSESVISESDDEHTPLFDNESNHGHRARSDSLAIHKDHHHNKPKAKSGHSHGNLNMRGVFLHVLGDALGNVGVILTALFVKFSPNYKLTAPFTNYADPFISLVITIIIFSSALPLVKSASKILLQGVPKGISLEEVKEDLRGIPGIEDIHELHIWQLSDIKMIASLHIQISFEPEQENGRKYMKLAKNVRTCLHAFGIHSVTIQPEYLAPGQVRVINAGREDEGYGTVRNSGRTSPSCLMDCTEGCVAGKCCGPATEPVGGHGHGHAH